MAISGLRSIALHRSKDGSHVVNSVQWRDADLSPSHTTRRSSARSGRNWEKLPTRLIRAFTTSFTLKRRKHLYSQQKCIGLKRQYLVLKLPP